MKHNNEKMDFSDPENCSTSVDAATKNSSVDRTANNIDIDEDTKLLIKVNPSSGTNITSQKHQRQLMIKSNATVGTPQFSNPTTKKVNDALRDLPITEETTCGIWFCKGPFLQRFANKKAYVTLYGVLGCIFSASYAYFNGTITTIEKRFKIPSRTTGKLSII